MDFTDVGHSQQMERFREEVRAWLEQNVPEEMKTPIDPSHKSEERYWFWREKNKELAAKGWYAPIFPKEYGGGGLSVEHEAIIREEFHRSRAPYRPRNYVYDALLVWATEAQKQMFLVPLLKAEKVSWQKFTEPHSGSDLASYESTAVKDGDDWIMNGSNAFPSGKENDSGWYFGPMKTDQNAPRHRNLGFFMIPYPSPGLEFRRMKMVHGDDNCFIFLSDVRVPGDHLIGGDHQGWQVANTSLEQEHGGQGILRYGTEFTENLLHYMREQRRQDLGPGGDPVAQQVAVGAFLESNTATLFGKRSLWMYHSNATMAWEGPLGFVYERASGQRTVGRIRDVMGMYSLLGTKDVLAPHGGAQEVHQRYSFIMQHGAGSFNISKVVLARRIGISRTQERAAPTPMTTGGLQGQR